MIDILKKIFKETRSIKRFLLFAFGCGVSILFLSMGPENRLKKTFYAYIDYFDINKRVMTHLYTFDDDGYDNTSFTTIAECQLVYYNIKKKDLLLVRDKGVVNFDLSDKNSNPCQYYVVENNVHGNILSVRFEYCYRENSVRVMTFTVNNESEVCSF